MLGGIRKPRRSLRIAVRSEEDAECLMQHLASHSPSRSRRTVRIELDEQSDSRLRDIMEALETCLSANDIPVARVDLNGHSYMLVPSV